MVIQTAFGSQKRLSPMIFSLDIDFVHLQEKDNSSDIAANIQIIKQTDGII